MMDETAGLAHKTTGRTIQAHRTSLTGARKLICQRGSAPDEQIFKLDDKVQPVF